MQFSAGIQDRPPFEDRIQGGIPAGYVGWIALHALAQSTSPGHQCHAA
jgi:hypothetical protein